MSRTARIRLASSSLIVVLLAACGGSADPGAQDPGEEPPATDASAEQDPTSDEDPTEAEPTEEPDPAAQPTEPAGDPAGGDVAARGDLAGIEVVPEGQELVLRRGDDVEVIGLLDPEGESFYRFATIWPGSTPDDLTIVAVTQAEGMYDLRWLTYRNGQDGRVEAFPSPYQPDTEMASVADVTPIPVFSPDGRSLAWLDWDADGAVTLRTVGWDGGPGTGRTADDNAAFGLDGLAPGVQLQSWTDGEGERSALQVLADEGTSWTITVIRQADGALALEADALRRD